MLNNRLAWICMESVALFGFWGTLLWMADSLSGTAWLAVVMWSVHYINRALIYPWRTHAISKRMPVVVMLFALLFNSVNSFVNGVYIASDQIEPAGQMLIAGTGSIELRALAGLLIFLLGFSINLRADNVLLALRSTGDEGYSIPRGGLFERVSCPNFLGEIVEWIGFAIFCWTLPALAFAVWTAANLVPRALAHHRWYRENFAEYPVRRKALVPSLL
jgi:3-oxo-5-alpha-steroid 4-dehydrogenase 1